MFVFVGRLRRAHRNFLEHLSVRDFPCAFRKIRSVAREPTYRDSHYGIPISHEVFTPRPDSRTALYRLGKHVPRSFTSQTPHLRTMASSSLGDHAAQVVFGQKHVTKGLGRQVEAVLTKAQGSYVTLGDGRQLLDFTCGIGVTNLGVYSDHHFVKRTCFTNLDLDV